ncbi:MAG: 30S ribosomal protein S17 [Candidatus Gracilibacteria bacterium]|nr:30S ribosomal protein S17 [Candidatus Gracilibacteria bacterium]
MRTKTGIVTSIKMDKTAVVTIDSYKIHPKYKKKFKISKKFYAHDENNSSELGQVVKISETRPLSKLKRWIIVD